MEEGVQVQQTFDGREPEQGLPFTVTKRRRIRVLDKGSEHQITSNEDYSKTYLEPHRFLDPDDVRFERT